MNIHISLPLVCLWFWWYQLEECHCPYPGSSSATTEISLSIYAKGWWMVKLETRREAKKFVWKFEILTSKIYITKQKHSKKTRFCSSSQRLPIYRSWDQRFPHISLLDYKMVQSSFISLLPFLLPTLLSVVVDFKGVVRKWFSITQRSFKLPMLGSENSEQNRILRHLLYQLYHGMTRGVTNRSKSSIEKLINISILLDIIWYWSID